MTSQLKRNNYENNYSIDDEKKFYDNYHKYAWSYARNYIEYDNINSDYNAHKNYLFNYYYDKELLLSYKQCLYLVSKDNHLENLLICKEKKYKELEYYLDKYSYYYNYYSNQ